MRELQLLLFACVYVTVFLVNKYCQLLPAGATCSSSCGPYFATPFCQSYVGWLFQESCWGIFEVGLMHAFRAPVNAKLQFAFNSSWAYKRTRAANWRDNVHIHISLARQEPSNRALRYHLVHVLRDGTIVCRVGVRCALQRPSAKSDRMQSGIQCCDVLCEQEVISTSPLVSGLPAVST